MERISGADKARFRTYLEDAERCVENLSFLIENLGERIDLNYSVESLERSEAVFWKCVDKGIPDDLSDLHQFAQLLGQYLGQCIIHHTGAKWIQSDEQNPMFAQPCIDGFGGQAWDRVYPVHAALHLKDLPREKPNFPGVQERRVLAAKLETTIAVYRRQRSSAQD